MFTFKRASAVIALCLGLAFISSPAFADDVSVGTLANPYEINYVGNVGLEEVIHEEGLTNPGEFKGWFNLTVKNTCTEDWGDFHFELFEAPGFLSPNTTFDIAGVNEPTSSQTGTFYTLSLDEKTLNFSFYSDPLAPGATATFSIYIDNPDQAAFFGVGFYPTPVPEPLSLVLLAAGLPLVCRRRK